MMRSRAQAVSRRHYRWQWFWLLLSLPLALILMLHDARADTTCGKLDSLAGLKASAHSVAYMAKPAQPSWALLQVAMPEGKFAHPLVGGGEDLAEAMTDAKRNGAGWAQHFWYTDCTGF